MKPINTWRSLAALFIVYGILTCSPGMECLAGSSCVKSQTELMWNFTQNPACCYRLKSLARLSLKRDLKHGRVGIDGVGQKGSSSNFALLNEDSLKVFASEESKSFSYSDSLERSRGTKGEVRLWTAEELKRVLESQAEPIGDGSGMVKKQKNARLAMLCSLIFPGLGQLYTGNNYKAVLAMGIETFYLSQILLNYRYARREERLRDRYPRDSYEYYRHNIWVDEYKARTVDWIWWTGGAMFLIIVDAYVDAHLYDMQVSLRADAGTRRVECSLGLNF